MKNLIHLIFLITLTLIGVLSCKKAENLNTPIDASLGKPDKVYNVTVKNDSARATLTYSLPKNVDLSYIKAVYKLADSSSREVKASIYDNKLTVDGFGDTSEHKVILYAVNKAEETSDPVEVIVKPLENPIWGIFRSLKVSPDFAGIRIFALNAARFNTAIEIFRDTLNTWVQYSGIYTSTDTINSPVRGMDTIPQVLAITVRDRFMNHTDTLFTTLTPYFETIIPKSWYREFTLPNDSKIAWTSNYVRNLWDGDIYYWPNCLITKEDGSPGIVTFDLGKAVKLSRLVHWDYPEYLNAGRTYFYGGNLKKFEIWGSTNPDLDGNWSKWVKLADCLEVKPSGLPYGTNSSEDNNAGYAGFSWDLDPTAPAIRYIRIKSIENWVGTSYMALSEVQAYGDPR